LSVFSQFRGGVSKTGRTQALKSVAYAHGVILRDERNNRAIWSIDHAGGKGIIAQNVRVPADAPFEFLHQSDRSHADHLQHIFTSLAAFEEKQLAAHPGRKGQVKGKAIISRQDMLLLDRRLVFNADGSRRDNWRENLLQVTEEFVRENFTRRGFIAAWSLHDEENGNGNFHVHVDSSYRALTATGWASRRQIPFGAEQWRAYASGKHVSLLRIQTRKLQSLGVLPKAAPERKRSTARVAREFRATEKTVAGMASGGCSPAFRSAGGGIVFREKKCQPAASQSVSPTLVITPVKVPSSGEARGAWSRVAPAHVQRLDVTTAIFQKYAAFIEAAEREGKGADCIAEIIRRRDDEVKAAENRRAIDERAERRATMSVHLI